MMERPALASSVLSGPNRIVAPLDPPVPSDASKVPEACQASRTVIGHALAFGDMIAERISDLMACDCVR